MYNKQKLQIYPNPQPAPSRIAEFKMFGFERVMVILRRIKMIVGFIIIAEQEVVNDRRIISWRLGNVYDEHCTVIYYNFTVDRDWFTIMDSPTCVVQEPDIEMLFERGENMYGPNGFYTFDEQAVLEVLEEIEDISYSIEI